MPNRCCRVACTNVAGCDGPKLESVTADVRRSEFRTADDALLSSRDRHRSGFGRPIARSMDAVPRAENRLGPGRRSREARPMDAVNGTLMVAGGLPCRSTLPQRSRRQGLRARLGERLRPSAVCEP